MNNKQALNYLSNISPYDSEEELDENQMDQEWENDQISDYENVEDENSDEENEEDDDSDDEGYRSYRRSSGRVNSLIESHEVPSQSKKSSEKWCPIGFRKCASFRNIIEFSANSGLTLYAKTRISSPLSAFRLLINDRILDQLVNGTNKNPEKPINWSLDKNTLLRFIAVLFCRGLYCQNTSVKRMWNIKTGPLIIKELLSRNKFITVMR